MNDRAHQRIGDIERSQALDRLGSYFADGYLDIDEFDTRTGAAAIARTAGEIDVLFTDLPEQQASTAVTPVQDDTEKERDHHDSPNGGVDLLELLSSLVCFQRAIFLGCVHPWRSGLRGCAILAQSR